MTYAESIAKINNMVENSGCLKIEDAKSFERILDIPSAYDMSKDALIMTIRYLLTCLQNATNQNLMEGEMSEEKKSHTFQGKTMKLKDLLPLIRMTGYSNRDNGGKSIILSPECEERTWVTFNENSCFLDLLGDLDVSSIDGDDGDLRLWIETDDYNWFDIAKRR